MSNSFSSFELFSNCYMGNEVPGRTIKESFGIVQQITQIITGAFDLNRALESLLQSTKSKIANDFPNQGKKVDAIINVRIVTISHQSENLNQVTTYIVMYGEAVALKPLQRT